jgi:hypothetical protein
LLDSEATTVVFQADAGAEIWNLVVGGSGVAGAGGLAYYAWPVSATSAYLTAAASFGAHSLTGLPAAVEADYLRRYYPDALDFQALSWLDTDGDGMETWKEFVAGTVPTDARSLFRLSQPPLPLAGNPLSVELVFESVTGKLYRAEMAESVAGPWSPTGAVLTATGALSHIQVQLPAALQKAFFRVSVGP